VEDSEARDLLGLDLDQLREVLLLEPLDILRSAEHAPLQ
jgi:hypothetical protein